jgi:hypothetical protein
MCVAAYVPDTCERRVLLPAYGKYEDEARMFDDSSGHRHSRLVGGARGYDRNRLTG